MVAREQLLGGAHARGLPGNGRRDGHQKRDAEGSRHLVDGVRRGLRMLDGLIGKRVDAPGVQRSHDELHADDEQAVGHAHRDDGRVDAEQGESGRADQDDDDAADHRDANAACVEDAPGQKAGAGADGGAGQKRQAADGGGVAERALDIERHDGADAHDGGLEHGDADDGDAVVAGAQDIDAQHRLLKMQLALRVGEQQHDADDDEADVQRKVRRGAEAGQAVEQAHQAEGGKKERGHVEARALEVAVGLDGLRGADHHESGAHGHDGEDGAPADGVHEHAGKRRADGGGEADDQADGAHGRAAAFTRDDQQDDAEHHGHDEAGCAGLQHASEQQQLEDGGHGRNDGADGEDGHAADEQLARVEAPHQKRRERDDHGFRERITGAEPLDGGRRHAHVRHDGGQRRGEQHGVEHRDERADKQHPDHALLVFLNS